MSDIKSAMEDEIDQNIKNCEKSYGSTLRFGSVVQFMHVQSQKFLTFFSEKSLQGDNENMAVGLGDEYNQNTFLGFCLCTIFNKVKF